MSSEDVRRTARLGSKDVIGIVITTSVIILILLIMQRIDLLPSFFIALAVALLFAFMHRKAYFKNYYKMCVNANRPEKLHYFIMEAQHVSTIRMSIESFVLTWLIVIICSIFWAAGIDNATVWISAGSFLAVALMIWLIIRILCRESMKGKIERIVKWNPEDE